MGEALTIGARHERDPYRPAPADPWLNVAAGSEDEFAGEAAEDRYPSWMVRVVDSRQRGT